MATYAVDSKRQAMTATGIVNEEMQWVDKPEGGRKKSDAQAHHPDTGMPLWQVTVVYTTRLFGQDASVTQPVIVGHPSKPEVQPFSPITVNVLEVDASLNKDGGFRENWRAESIDEFVPATDSKLAARPAASSAKEKAA